MNIDSPPLPTVHVLYDEPYDDRQVVLFVVGGQQNGIFIGAVLVCHAEFTWVTYHCAPRRECFVTRPQILCYSHLLERWAGPLSRECFLCASQSCLGLDDVDYQRQVIVGWNICRRICRLFCFIWTSSP